MTVDHILLAIPPLAVYLIVGLVVGVESLGIPLPGEIVLVSAALLASHHQLAVDPVAVGGAAIAGAVVGDSIGYLIGRRYGMTLFDRLGRRFPKHFGPRHVALAERFFGRWGMWAVFFGRFVALLRIFAGPLAGALRMHYPRFLVANVAGAIAWAGGTTAAVYYLGIVAEKWLSRFSWVGLGVAVVVGVAVALVVRRRTHRMLDEVEVPDQAAPVSAGDDTAGSAGTTGPAGTAGSTAPTSAP
ncbi:DedA family protein [Pseudonocardia sp. RS11V-5]|uniref:DedA family protein n=1 Tax=Pseudonocardia terrae TaxID=2905831 RepID=UPI001E412DCA|nr:DedA family protein [Pseudonocardia terrae]MCE3552340.1 DedA family protein [Pseudonocardia terrae]